MLIRTPWGIVSVKGGVARKLGLLPKMPSCLGPIAYTYNLDRRNRQYFTSLMTSIYNFLIFWTFHPQLLPEHLGILLQ